jgi:hemoglobin-like flavoprotein
VLNVSGKIAEESIAVVSKSWSMIDKRLDEFSDTFYSISCTIPHIAKLFAKTPMTEQRAKFGAMVKLIIENLKTPGDIVEELRALAIRHVRYGVCLSYYNEVGIALLATLKQLLPVAWDSKLEFAWRVAYTFVATTMMEAARPEYAKIGQLPPGSKYAHHSFFFHFIISRFARAGVAWR